MRDSLVKIAVASPKSEVANVKFNIEECISAVVKAESEGAKILAFPELSVSSYTAGDLFFQSSFIDACETAVREYLDRTRDIDVLTMLGAPIKNAGKLYDCIITTLRGEILGISVKSSLSRDEERYFSRLSNQSVAISYAGQLADMSESLIFEHYDMPRVKIFPTFASELERPCGIVGKAALAGATLISLAAARCEELSQRQKILSRLEAASDTCRCALLYANSGEGESTTDCVYSSNSFITELGRTLCEIPAFCEESLCCSVVDFEKIESERLRNNGFLTAEAEEFLYVPYNMELSDTDIGHIEKSPFIPKDEGECDSLCSLALKMQAHALAKRIKASRSKTVVLGVSGGLDSTLALLVCAGACDLLGMSRDSIIAVTMPCFGTTKRTKSNAVILSRSLGATVLQIDIKKSVTQHFRDIGHADDDYNVVYENAQARERTQVLMDIANERGGIVCGTGDLSELALGFATYNGDQMSNYGVNSGVPKTLLRSIISYYAKGADKQVRDALNDVLKTPVSPELLPPKDSEISQCTEGIVGPYELHDFFLYYFIRYGFSPRKIKRLAVAAFKDEYDADTVDGWLRLFLRRFVTQQFKRSAMPDGVKLLDVSLSPRGALNMPSDASFAFLIENLDGDSK